MKKIYSIISKTIDQDEITFEELFFCVESIKKEGDIFILKSDGESNINTVMIMFPNSDREMVRHDGLDVKETIVKALKDY